ncbi:3-oxoacyl-ACP synthase III [Chitinophaga nivalis]|uniref:3-oxoacyl-ACP synthase III n=1 Tax=Chitinophaga nivalis TaxID=2991709 RepID=A0ABT3IM28_9BACT|nr:3-oxoacyl-ACP synthase III [Chitinophaga nivalis]MCW3465293.1 3-oxoacyl-ACP synthase III [Chitinophaga nivalis]MCW3485015.1 3-oxoacyl-ACP synthase III [Chitinophaga nivalis]
MKSLMHYSNTAIYSVEHRVPDDIIRTDDLETQLAPAMRRFGYGQHLLSTLTGINQRRHWKQDVKSCAIAIEVGRAAIKSAGIDRGEVGVLINTTILRDHLEPADASFIHMGIGLGHHCINFDIGNACLSFINGMQIVANMIEREQIKFGLIVCAENTRVLFDNTMAQMVHPDCPEEIFRRNFATLTLGSGAAAMVLGQADKNPQMPRIKHSHAMSNTDSANLCYLKSVSEGLYTDMSPLLKEGLALFTRNFSAGKEMSAWNETQMNWLVPHLISRTALEQLARLLQIDIQKIIHIFPEYGNIATASIPAALSIARSANTFKKGDQILLGGSGSGLNSMIIDVTW